MGKRHASPRPAVTAPEVPGASAEATNLVIPIAVHGSSKLIFVLANMIALALIARDVYRPIVGAEGAHAVGAVFAVALIAFFDYFALPMLKVHHVVFERDRLVMSLGRQTESLRYADIQSVSEGGARAVATHWRPTGPGAVWIHAKMFDGAVDVEQKELFYEELQKEIPASRSSEKPKAT